MTYHFPTRRSAVLPARWVVRNGGLEPPRLAAPAPKAGASTNSATFAIPGSLPVQARFYARGGDGGKEAKKSTSPDSGERVSLFFLTTRVSDTCRDRRGLQAFGSNFPLRPHSAHSPPLFLR